MYLQKNSFTRLPVLYLEEDLSTRQVVLILPQTLSLDWHSLILLKTSLQSWLSFTFAKGSLTQSAVQFLARTLLTKFAVFFTFFSGRGEGADDSVSLSTLSQDRWSIISQRTLSQGLWSFISPKTPSPSWLYLYFTKNSFTTLAILHYAQHWLSFIMQVSFTWLVVLNFTNATTHISNFQTLKLALHTSAKTPLSTCVHSLTSVMNNALTISSHRELYKICQWHCHQLLVTTKSTTVNKHTYS